MSPTDTLDIVSDLLAQAEEIRPSHPDVARKIEESSQALLGQVPALSVAETARFFGQSRPTIHAWLETGLLAHRAPEGRGVRISPESVLRVLPALRAWEAKGRPGRASTLLRRWVDGELELRERRRAGAAERRQALQARLRRNPVPSGAA
jgi:DNA-binding transcriptional MerR regulator